MPPLGGTPSAAATVRRIASGILCAVRPAYLGTMKPGLNAQSSDSANLRVEKENESVNEDSFIADHPVLGVLETAGTNSSEGKLYQPRFSSCRATIFSPRRGFRRSGISRIWVPRCVRRAKPQQRPTRSGRNCRWRPGSDLWSSGEFRRDAVRVAATTRRIALGKLRAVRSASMKR